ncbi:DUF5986 family protein [Exiguobacterium sp. s162]|uniref:DUF5986 family protein n=1 Tax=Exiguobacterium sp. s162 TaxID=2751276 RepID=UPI001BE65567
MQYTSPNKIANLVNAFTESVDFTLTDIKNDYDLTTENGKHGLAWDIRFDRIKTSALSDELVVLTKKRNNLWSFICVLDDQDSVLYIFVKDKNLKRIKKKFGKNSIHYFHAFVSINGQPYNLNETQLSLFQTLSSEYEMNRVLEVQKVLGDDHLRVKEVKFIVAKEEAKQIIGAEVHKYDSFFNLISIEDYSNHISTPTFSDVITNTQVSEISETQEIIPKIKDSLKKRRQVDNNPIPKNKQINNQETKNKL